MGDVDNDSRTGSGSGTFVAGNDDNNNKDDDDDDVAGSTTTSRMKKASQESIAACVTDATSAQVRHNPRSSLIRLIWPSGCFICLTVSCLSLMIIVNQLIS